MDTLIDAVNPIPDVAKCLISSGKSLISGTDALSAVGDVEGCLSSIEKSIPGLDKVIKALQCGKDLLNACKDKKPVAPMSPSPAPEGGPASLALVGVQVERLAAVLGAWEPIFGDAAWFQGTQGTNLVTWMAEFHARAAAGSEAGERIAETERAVLLATAWPGGLGETNLTRFLERWNRTVDYYAQGILKEADLPGGWDTNFIAYDVLTNAVAQSVRAIEESQAAGFADPFDALQDAARQLQFELGTPSGEGVCGRITLRLDQQAVISRDAFQATIEIANSTDSTLAELSVELMVLRADGEVVTDLFGLRAPVLAHLTAVDGTGSIGPHTTASASWTLIPTMDAAPAAATEYYVSGVLRYRHDDAQITVPLTAVAITVHPNPRLYVKYFHQRDVYADDPFTPVVEPSIPYSLAVMVENRGFGEARQMRITSAQPEIVENEKGLLIDFQIIASEAEGQSLTPSLTVNLGNIGPGQSKLGRWLLTSTLQGLFTGYRATFEHIDSLGNAKLSLIEAVTIHELIHLVQAGGAFEDGRPDFLVNQRPDPLDLPDTLYLSDGATNTVSVVEDATDDGPPSAAKLEVRLQAAMPAGWAYLRLPDRSAGQLRLVRVARTGGAALALGTNVWTTDRTFLGLGKRPVTSCICSTTTAQGATRSPTKCHPRPTRSRQPARSPRCRRRATRKSAWPGRAPTNRRAAVLRHSTSS